MPELVALHQQHPEISMRRFAPLVGVKYSRLRDFIQGEEQRSKREKKHQEQGELVRTLAQQHPTFGYRKLYQAMVAQEMQVGREWLRGWLRKEKLSPEPHVKRRKPRIETLPESKWPEGRRVQIDATMVKLPKEGKVWIYQVLDVESRLCLAAEAFPTLSSPHAVLSLKLAVAELKKHVSVDKFLIQSDAGSDFTSDFFQAVCRELGEWVRCRTSQKGGMGMLERLNRTLKYEVIFRHDPQNLSELKTLLSKYRVWYNMERLHSALQYLTPMQFLQKSANIIVTS